jgi:hypothetical protein
MRHKRFTLLNLTRSVRSNLTGLKLSIVLLLGPALTGVQAQTMFVKESNGIQTAYALSNMRKIFFSAGNLTVTETDNSSGVYALNGLRCLNFSDLTPGLEEHLDIQDQRIITYPNPATNVLNIDLSGVCIPEGTISILSIEGKTIKNQKVTGGSIISVDLSQLPEGIYLCRYSSLRKILTVKIIKQ